MRRAPAFPRQVLEHLGEFRPDVDILCRGTREDKGADLVALRIRESARAHHVTMLEAPALARAIFSSTKIGHEIPAGLYVAVAQVLAYVFQLKRAMPGAVMPILPAEFFIPPELRE